MQGEEEWKNIHTMLNCISAMVDKTKRAITILQQRGVEPQQPNFGEVTPATLMEIRRQTEEKVAEFKRNAEDAVNQVSWKKQSVDLLKKSHILFLICFFSHFFPSPRLNARRSLKSKELLLLPKLEPLRLWPRNVYAWKSFSLK